jgi:ubiquinone/menaquinone biosynthesis C-methylase UbiE
MPTPLLQVFSQRPSRYALLDKGLAKLEFSGHQSVLEIGCAYGDAVYHIANRYPCDITGIDQSEDLIRDATLREDELLGGSRVEFRSQNAEDLRFLANSFDLIVSEAAFSPLHHQEMAVKNYRRVLKTNGQILINDFAIRYKGYEHLQPGLTLIPCFSGVKTMDDYVRLFENNNFKSVLVREEYGEFIALALHLGKMYGVAVKELGGFLASYINGTSGKKCDDNTKTPQVTEDFLKKAKLTYCQMIFKKTE